MIFWLFLGVALGVTLVLALVWRVVWRKRIDSPRRYWGRVALLHVVLLGVHAVVTVPAALGWIGSRWVGTRSDERAYLGPRFEGDTWVLQDSDTLRDAGDAGAGAANPLEVFLESGDGLGLRGFHVLPAGEPRVAVVMVHGLFRGAMELEPVASMFRREGAAVLMLELRNHGGSDRAPFTGGRDESQDVLAGAEFMVERHPDLPLAVFGASLGTAAVSLAALRIPGLDGVWLDAPMDDFELTARRFLSGRSRIHIIEPFRSLVLRALELWSGFRLTEVRPALALHSLPAEVTVQLVAAGKDRRMPIEAVRRIYAGLPQPEGRRDLWFAPEASHAKVWFHAPAEYRARVREFVAALVEGG